MRRWHAELPLMEKRLKMDSQIRSPFGPRPLGAQRKRHPHDCGHTRCLVCHSEKYLIPKRRQSERRAVIDFELSASA